MQRAAASAQRRFQRTVAGGRGAYQVTQKNGERWSAARAYLPPEARSRANLHIATGSRALRVALDGKRATGVVCRRGKADETITARRAVILSAGAFQSPQLLQLSGIGPGAELKRHGIAVAHELAGVGQNLQDHLDFTLLYRARSPHLFGFTPGGMTKLPNAIRAVAARAARAVHHQLRRVRRLPEDRSGAAAAGHPVAFCRRPGRRPRAQAAFLHRLQPAHVRAAAARAGARSACATPTR